uniref:Uncharacterized protein n=1 Tax=Populus trichocarpa TaxID=3694 RepID=U5GQ27_POPTR
MFLLLSTLVFCVRLIPKTHHPPKQEGRHMRKKSTSSRQDFKIRTFLDLNEITNKISFIDQIDINPISYEYINN